LLAGFWHSHVGWMFDGDITNPVRYSKDLLRDPAVNRLNRLYLLWVLVGLTLPAALVAAATRSWTAAIDTLLWAGFVRVFTVHHATWAVNSVTHLWGSSPFRSADRSVNVAWLAVPTAGESWHNCHHAFPGSARFGLAWWQLDLGYVLIWTLARLGLARDVRQPSPSARASAYKTAASHSQDSRVRAP
jgi:stearoyl-CoA desaturase (delta-9 desaturase)